PRDGGPGEERVPVLRPGDGGREERPVPDAPRKGPAMTTRLMSRRTVLKGLGVALALPWLEAMGPLTSWAGESLPSRPAPNRMAFLYVPNGVNMADWTPRNEGPLAELPAILEPLEALKQDVLVLSNLTADKARPHGDGGGDHARALASFLTGCQARKTDGTDI